MARIAISLSGEGRGHATRVRALIEALRARHRLEVFAPGDAFELLAPVYADSPVRVRWIPCLRFAYDGRERLDLLRTAWTGARYVARLPALVGALCRALDEFEPDLVLTDFEPALPRAARRVGVPFVSLTHQHLLPASDWSFLPASLRAHAELMALFVRGYYQGAARTIVSSFHYPAPRRGWERIDRIGVLHRPSVRKAHPTRGEHVLAYFRRSAPPRALEALARLGVPVQVYGLGARPRAGRVEFRAIDEHGFVDELASCRALVCTAGNQLVGEALHFGKPVLACPEVGNREQEINARLLAASGAGCWMPFDRLDERALREFLATCTERAHPSLCADGVHAAVRAIEAQLPGRVRVSAPAVAVPA